MTPFKVLLILPPFPAHYVTPPVGLGYLATCVRKQGLADVAILDGQKERLSPVRLGEILRAQRPDVVGVQVFSSTFAAARGILKTAREVLPASTIVVGGPHVTATPQRVLEDIPEADYGFCGEAEPGFPQLVARLSGHDAVPLADIPGLIFREDGTNVVNRRALVEDLDGLGFPAWECMRPDSYPPSPQGAFFERYPIAPILTSRGCPYQCTFCGSPVNMTRRYRTRSIGHVLDEVSLLYHDFGVREIHIIDDMFSLQKQRVLDFCDGLEARRLDIAYTFPNGLRLDSLDKQMLTRMKATGVYAFTVGIESGSQRILDLMKKGISTDEVREKVALIKDCGIEPSGFFIIGFPGETPEDIDTTIRFACELPLKRAHFSNYLPLPGTESARLLCEQGEVSPGNWDELAYHETPYSPKGISRQKLKRLQRKAFLRFHLRPRILLKLLGEIRSFAHLRGLLARVRDYLF